MTRPRNYLFLILLAYLFQSVTAQPVSPFPYQLKPWREVSLMVPGSLLLHYSAYGHNQKTAMTADEVAKLDASQVNPFDRIATRWHNPRLNEIRETFEPASVLLAGTVVGGGGLYYKFTTFEWTPLMTLGLMYIEGAYLATGTMLASKVLFNRPRPYTYNTNLTPYERARGGNNESFFSGNATILFYNAAFVSKVIDDLFDNKVLTRTVWASTLALASLSGYWSVRSGMHFPTDVLTGALTGILAGVLIPEMHKIRNQGLAVAPWFFRGGKGISVSWAL